MRGRIYFHGATLSTVTTAIHLVELTASANNVTRIFDAHVTSPDIAASDIIELAWRRKTGGGTPTWTTSVSAADIGREDPGAPDPSTTVKLQQSGGTDWTFHAASYGYEAVDLVDGWRHLPPNEQGLVLQPSEVGVLDMFSLAITSADLNIFFKFEEIGA